MLLQVVQSTITARLLTIQGKDLGPIYIGNKNFLDVTSDVSEGCREGFLETNKKTNYIARQKTARQIY